MPRPLTDRLLPRRAELLGRAHSLRSATEPRPPHAPLRSAPEADPGGVGGAYRGWSSKPRPRPPRCVGAGSRVGTSELRSRRAMAGLLTLLGPAGRVGAQLRPLAPWLPGTATSCAPPLWALALSRPGPDTRLLRTARGDCLRRQVRLPTPTRTLIPK